MSPDQVQDGGGGVTSGAPGTPRGVGKPLANPPHSVTNGFGGTSTPAGSPTPAPSLREFLTDASLAAACDELSRTTRVPVWLRDRSGEAIIPEVRESLWQIVPDAEAAQRSFKIAGRRYDPEAETFAAPLRISTGTLGWLVMPVWTDEDDESPGDGSGEGTELRERMQLTRSLQTALVKLAATVSEGCEAQVALRQRVQELGALYRFSSLLAQSEDVEKVLSVALELSMDVLRADAGSLAVVRDDSSPATGADGELVIRSYRGLSGEWVADGAPLSREGVLRKAALSGEVITVFDLLADGRVIDPERVKAEGIRGLLSTGLLYQGRPVGLIRLYTKTPRKFTRVEQGLLKSIADQCASALTSARLRKLREEDERVQRQVRLAADVQRRMLPRTTPDIPALDVAAKYVPSFALGGDFYDFIPLGGHIGIVVGDVVGKGVPAALLMSAVRASLRAHAQDVYDLDEVLLRVNAALAADTRDDEFATLWYGVADPVTLKMTYCNAGHNPPILVKKHPGGGARTEADTHELAVGGMALGIDKLQKYQKGMVQLAAGDVLIAYTDGMTDAADFQGRRYGRVRLRDAVLATLAREPAATSARIVEQLFWELRQFSGLNQKTDDITLIVVRVKG